MKIIAQVDSITARSISASRITLRELRLSGINRVELMPQSMLIKESSKATLSRNSNNLLSLVCSISLQDEDIVWVLGNGDDLSQISAIPAPPDSDEGYQKKFWKFEKV